MFDENEEHDDPRRAIHLKNIQGSPAVNIQVLPLQVGGNRIVFGMVPRLEVSERGRAQVSKVDGSGVMDMCRVEVRAEYEDYSGAHYSTVAEQDFNWNGLQITPARFIRREQI
jgi:hypothetical protein